MSLRIEDTNPESRDQNGGSWIPTTPAKPNSTKQQPIYSNQANLEESERMTRGKLSESVRLPWDFPEEASSYHNVPASYSSANSIGVTQGLNTWQAGFAANSDVYMDALCNFDTWQTSKASSSGLYGESVQMNNFSMNDADKWTDMSFGALLALADNSASISMPHIFEGGNSATPMPCFDLNFVPKETKGAAFSTSASLHFQPITPEKHRPDSEANQLCETTTAGQLQETHKPDKGGVNEAADLSKTPEQKKPRRRKHRPKVVKEGKTKRSPKTCPEKKPSPPDEIPRVKRKYVRRKDVNNPANSSLEGETNKIDSNEQSSTTNGTPVGKTEFMRSKGIEKPESAMNKGTETDNINTVKYTRNSCRRSLNFDTEAHVRDEASSYCPSLNSEMEEQIVNLSATDQSRTNVQSHVVEEIMVKRDTGPTFQEREVNMSKTARFRQRPIPSTMADHQSEYSRGKCQIVFSDVTHDKVENNVHVMVYKEGKWVPKSIDEAMSRSSCLISEKQTIGLKRQHVGTIAEAETCIANATATFYNSVPTRHSEISQNANKSDCSPGMYFYKKTRTALRFDAERSSLQYTTIASGSCLKPETRNPVQQSTSATNQATDLLTINPTVDGTQCGRQIFENLLALGPIVKNKKKRGKACEDETMSPKPKKKGSKKSSFKNSTTQNIYMGSQPAIKWKSMSPVDSLIEQLNELDLNANWSQVSVQKQNAYMAYHYQQQNAYMAYHYQQQNAIVPYQRGGAVVPFDGQVKRKRARPKVDLDDETTRVWRLLLENINSEGVDGTDEEKMRWWDEERRVFTGRADSFIARMHLVQGDRRFSPWKGSVVDSVVGVFLTQNVSDHLSSSAFMSLAARFPLEPKTSPVELHDAGPSHNSQEREIWLLDPELNENLLLEPEKSPEKCVPIISLESDSNKSINLTGDGRDMDEVVSSQNSVVTSVDSPVAQTTERIESCSLSNSDEEPAAKPDRFARSTSFVKLLQMADTMLHGSTEISGLSIESASETVFQKYTSVSSTEGPFSQLNDCSSDNIKIGMNPKIVDKQEGKVPAQGQFQENSCNMQNRPLMDFTGGSSSNVDNSRKFENSEVNSSKNGPKANGGKIGKEQQNQVDWDRLRKQAQDGGKKERTVNTMDTVDWEAVRCADVNDIAQAVKERGMNNVLAERIKDFLNRIVRDHGSIDLEWLRDVPPDKAKEYLLSVRGLGLKSVECVRLLTLHHLAFPVDTNVGRIAVRLGWVPLQPLPESLQLHLLELYPIMESIQKYLWPRLCKLDQRTLYELHYQLITFGKVFCTKSKPNCNACPMRGECRHFASAFASARLALPAPEDKRMVSASENKAAGQNPTGTSVNNMLQLPSSQAANPSQLISGVCNSLPIIEEPNSPEPIIEVPATPEYEQDLQRDIEDAFYEDPDEIPTIQLNMEQFTQNLQKVMQHSTELQEGDFSKALVALTPEAASIPVPKLKNISRLRTEHQVYELPDSHPVLEGLQVDKREPDDPSPYLLAIWTPGETEDSIEPPERRCSSTGSEKLCTDEACLSCNSIRELNSQTVRGTLLIPCRTAMRGSFPLNGTYFQVNEVFSDHESSKTPMDVPREWLWNLPRRTVYFGTSVPTIFKGLTTEQIQYCFWRGFVCVRGFDRVLRAPRPLIARLHFPASKLAKGKEKTGDN